MIVSIRLFQSVSSLSWYTGDGINFWKKSMSIWIAQLTTMTPLKGMKSQTFLWKKNCSGNIIWFYAKAKRPDTPPVAFMCYPTTTIAAKILGRRYRSYQIYRAVNPPTSMLWVQWDLRIGPQFNLNVCYNYYFIRKSKIYCHS